MLHASFFFFHLVCSWFYSDIFVASLGPLESSSFACCTMDPAKNITIESMVQFVTSVCAKAVYYRIKGFLRYLGISDSRVAIGRGIVYSSNSQNIYSILIPTSMVLTSCQQSMFLPIHCHHCYSTQVECLQAWLTAITAATARLSGSTGPQRPRQRSHSFTVRPAVVTARAKDQLTLALIDPTKW